MQHAFPCGTLVLDFLGTRRARRNPEPREMLATTPLLDAWFVEAGMVDGAPGADDGDLATAVELREAVYRLVTARMDGDELAADDVALVNRHAAGTPVTSTLDAGAVRRHGDVGQGLAALAHQAVEILGGPDGALLRECARPECTQVYLDTSRGHRREWCAMRTCGNRVKAQAYRARQKEAAEA